MSFEVRYMMFLASFIINLQKAHTVCPLSFKVVSKLRLWSNCASTGLKSAVTFCFVILHNTTQCISMQLQFNAIFSHFGVYPRLLTSLFNMYVDISPLGTHYGGIKRHREWWGLAQGKCSLQRSK